MEKALQESMRNLHRFQPDFTSILDAFSAYFGSQRASKINENSGRGLERPLEASGVAFGRPLGRIWRLWRRQLAKIIANLADCAGPLSQSRSRQSSTDKSSHALLPRRGAPDPPQCPRAFLQTDPKSGVCWLCLASKTAFKISIDF